MLRATRETRVREKNLRSPTQIASLGLPAADIPARSAKTTPSTGGLYCETEEWGWMFGKFSTVRAAMPTQQLRGPRDAQLQPDDLEAA